MSEHVTQGSETVPAISGDFAGKDIVSIGQFALADVERVMREADTMRGIVKADGYTDLLRGRVMANLFYEPSTRTFLSFEAAAKRLGASTIATQGVEYSSIAKGETLADTVRTVECYADIITLRHGQIGAAAEAATAAKVPVINAGDGAGEHPTQALLDLYTIKQKLGTLEGLRVTMVGDLKNGRTVHSLARLLALHEVDLQYVSPEETAMPENLVDELAAKGTQQYATTNLDEVLPTSDVLYVTRVQKERFKSEESYWRLKDSYVVDAAALAQLPREAIVMHPLPRVSELPEEVDSDPRTVIFDQVENGMYVRMGLLALVAGQALAADRANLRRGIMEA